MKHEAYWKQRFIQLENSQHGMTATAFAKIEAQYRAAQKEIEGQIALWYQRFADNNGINMAEARQWISGNALKELKWDVKEYIKYGKENALLGGAWMQELENASAKFHISKLEALKIHTQQSLEKLFSKQESTIAGLLGDVYKSGYYHTAYELQKGFGIGFDIAAVDQSYLEKVLSKPWAVDGKNFSERIWGNKEKIIQEAHTEISRNILTGGDPQKAIDALSKKFQTSKNNAARLVQTEQAYFSSLAQKECFKDLGVEEYEIVATLDSHTSDICQGLDGQHFPMKDFEAGITAPPFHVNCRSTTAPYFAENFGQIGGRAARDAETGKTYYVPEDVKYADWKAAFVDGDKSGFDVSSVDGITHYTHPPQPEPPPPPKKEYLTEKKLKANIANADLELENLEKQADQVLDSTGYTYEEIKQAGGVEQFYKSEKLADEYYKMADEKIALEKKYGGYDALWDHGADDDIVKYDSLDDEHIKLEAALKKQGLKVDSFGHIEGLTREDVKKALQDKAQLDVITAKMEQINAQKAEWEEKLSQKLIAKEKKALTKQKIALKAQLDQAKKGIKTYSGIWKDDVTTADWSHLNIDGKKQYYESKLITENDPALMQKYMDYYKQLQELDSEGKALYDVEKELAKIENRLKTIENGGKIIDNPFTQERKDAALWAKTVKQADNELRAKCGEVWRNAPAREKDAIYEYTKSYSKYNEPLRGIEYGTNKYLGVGNVDFDKIGTSYGGYKPGEVHKAIKDMTNIISKSTYDFDMWIQRGCRYDGMDKFFNIPLSKLQHATQAELEALLKDKEVIEYGFGSCGVSKGKGFSHLPIIMNIYAPKGTQIMYAEPFSHYGNGAKRLWDGLSKQNSYGNEAEIILQQGTKFRITKIERSNGKLYFDLEVIEQNPQQ